MPFTERVDAMVISTTERVARSVEAYTGWSNFTLLRVCSGAYALVMVTLLMLQTSAHEFREALLACIALGSAVGAFYFSFFACDKLEVEARARMKHGEHNERRAECLWRRLRLSMLTSLALLLLFFLYIAYYIPNFYEHRGLVLYMFVCGATALLLSLCLLLEVCDPLPQT